ncbi:hypothetical protein GCM10022419_045490 [Nonomuraea rosea]|uniref:Secreted protein n=1 Tax=Nonomuraea rosea TaxID=638574 RepID=A0ABP6X3I0_9ACTN
MRVGSAVVVISLQDTTRGTRPAAPAQAADYRQDNQRTRKITGNMDTPTAACAGTTGPVWLRLPGKEITATPPLQCDQG